MKKALIPIAILLGAIIGAGGYFAASRFAVKGPPPEDTSVKDDLAEVRKTLSAVEGRLAKLEARPSLEEELSRSAVRKRIAAIIQEAKKPKPTVSRTPPRGRPGWLKAITDRYRTRYAEVLADMKRTLKLKEAKWKELQPIFDKHFVPVEAVLKKMEAGKLTGSVRANERLKSSIPVTLAALKKSLPAETWRAFDSWRKADRGTKNWGMSKGEFFLDGEDYKDFRVRKAVAAHWGILRRELSKLYKDLPLNAAKRKRLEEMLKAHLRKGFTAIRHHRRFNLHAPNTLEKFKTIAQVTEAELGKLLGKDGLAKFNKWKATPGNMARYYFGELYKPLRKTKPPSRTQAGPPENF